MIWIALALFGLQAGALAQTRSPTTEERRARVEDWVRGHLVALHLPRDHVDAEALSRECVEARSGCRSGEDKAWLVRQVFSARLAAAPRGAIPDPDARYRMPFDTRFPRILLFGYGEASHEGFEEFSLDFALPLDAEIRAARGGRVIHTVDGFTEGARDPKFFEKANSVFILHEDGTVAMYVHLQPRLSVRQGDIVKTGEVLGRAGKTGYAELPHLHFSTRQVREDGTYESFPVRFGRGEGLALESGRRYGWQGRGNVELKLTIGGATPADFHPLAEGDAVELSVWRRGRGGIWADVTRSPFLTVDTLSPAGFHVSGNRVIALPGAGYESVRGKVRFGRVRAVFQQGNQRGFVEAGFIWPGESLPERPPGVR